VVIVAAAAAILVMVIRDTLLAQTASRPAATARSSRRQASR